MPIMNARVNRKKLNLDNLRTGIVRVGWFSGSRYEDGVPVAAVAQWNEFGTISGKYRIPPRPFVRPVVFGKQKFLQEKLRDLYSMALKNNTNTEKSLAYFGEYVVELIQRQIDATVSPANSQITLHGGWLRTASGKPFYVEKKRGSHPLIDTGYMRDTLTYQVEEIHR